ILLAGHLVARRQVAAQHLALPAAVEADDRVALHRTAHRHRGRQDRRRWRDLTKRIKAAIDRSDEFGDLLRRQRVMRQILGHDLRDEALMRPDNPGFSRHTCPRSDILLPCYRTGGARVYTRGLVLL